MALHGICWLHDDAVANDGKDDDNHNDDDDCNDSGRRHEEEQVTQIE